MLTKRWLPWRGKRFGASSRSGGNIFSKNSLRLARVIWPVFAGYVADTPDTYRAFGFKPAPSLDFLMGTERARPRLRPRRESAGQHQANPRRDGPARRRILPGQSPHSLVLGSWQTIAYFSLTKEGDG